MDTARKMRQDPRKIFGQSSKFDLGIPLGPPCGAPLVLVRDSGELLILRVKSNWKSQSDHDNFEDTRRARDELFFMKNMISERKVDDR